MVVERGRLGGVEGGGALLHQSGDARRGSVCCCCVWHVGECALTSFECELDGAGVGLIALDQEARQLSEEAIGDEPTHGRDG